MQKGKFHIKTFGCQMNTHDSERMSTLLTEQGYAPTDAVEGADIIIYNSCSVRGKAEQKAYSSMGLIKDAKKLNPKLVVGFTGCVAQQEGKDVFQGSPQLDFVLGTDSIDSLPEVIYRVQNGERKILQVGFDPSNDYSLETKLMPGKSMAYVNIMKGCDNFCTYCIVPFTRGREKSRTMEEVVQDVKRLVLGGVVEIMLLGQNVNSYGKSLGGKKSGQTFANLLRALQEMSDRMDREGVTDPTGRSGKPRGLRRIRYTTSHPKDFDDEMIECHATLSRLVPQLHLPVQSGSAKILKRMKRYVPIKSYIEKLEKLRERVPGIALSTDIIVGFPGEEEEDFQATMDLLETVRFDNMYSYSYSARPGTAALKFGDTVPELEKRSRLVKLQLRQADIQTEKNKSILDSVTEVLVEGPSKTNPEVAMGRTPESRIVNFPLPKEIKNADLLTGKFVAVKLKTAGAFAFKGEAIL